MYANDTGMPTVYTIMDKMPNFWMRARDADGCTTGDKYIRRTNTHRSNEIHDSRTCEQRMDGSEERTEMPSALETQLYALNMERTAKKYVKYSAKITTPQ